MAPVVKLSSESMYHCQISDMLYSIYGRMRRSEQLTRHECQLLQKLQADAETLNEEHRSMLRRINYRLGKHQRQRQPSFAA